MKKIRALILAAALTSSLLPCAWAFELGVKGYGDTTPPVRLVYPVSENVDLAQNASLVFQWNDNFIIDTDSYDFRLYKGYDIDASSLLVRLNVDNDQDTAEVDSSYFKDGETYTWSLIRIDKSGQKSERAYNSFRANRQ